MATATIRPDGDITANWDTTIPATPTTHYTSIDEDPDSPTDGEYNETITVSDVDEISFDASPSDVDTVTDIEIKIRARITDAGGTKIIRLELFHSGTTAVTGNPKDVSVSDLSGSGTLSTITKTWTSLTLTKAQIDSLQLRMTYQ